MLTLTADDYNDIRLLTGTLTEDDDLTDAQINGQAINGAASDWAKGELLRYVNVDALQVFTDIETLRNSNIDSISFAELTSIQEAQLKRAVIYRCAGIAVELLRPVTQEGSSDIVTQRRATPEWKELQDDLFAKAEAEIVEIRQAYDDDAWLDSAEAIIGGYAEDDGAFFVI